MLTSIECVFLDFWDARGLGLLFMVCACAVGVHGNRLTGTRGTWGVVWRSAHVPTIPFTWLRRANAWTPSAHASNYQALFSIKLCKQCGFNSCVRVLYSMGSRGLKPWFVTSISHMGEMRDSDWSRENLLRSDWSDPKGATYTTLCLLVPRQFITSNAAHNLQFRSCFKIVSDGAKRSKCLHCYLSGTQAGYPCISTWATRVNSS